MKKTNTKEKTIKSQTFVKGAMIMSLALVVVKICGMIYKVALTRVYGIFGDELAEFGIGLFNNAYEIYVPLFTIATAGLPIAVSRMISESNAQKRYKDIRQIHKVSIPFFLLMGIICTLLMFCGSFFYVNLIGSPYAIYSMIALCPTIFFGCLVSIYRGYFEGMRNMTPTSVSEIIEGASKLCFGLTFSYLIMHFGLNSYESTGTIFGLVFDSEKNAIYTLVGFSVAGAVMGIVVGTVLSFLYLIIKYKRMKGGITQEQLKSSVDARAKNETFRQLIKTAIPIGLGALVMNISGTIDGAIIQNILADMSVTHGDELIKIYPMYKDAISDGTIQTKLWGCYGSALTLMQLVTVITQAFGTTAMPMVTNAYTKGDKKELRIAINRVLKLTCLVTFPCGIGLAVLARPIMDIVYGGNVAVVGGGCLEIMGIAVLFMAGITPICSMLQGVGKVNTPVKLYSVAVIIKIIMNYLLVSIVGINVKGAATGTLVGFLVACIIAMYVLVKSTGIRPDFVNAMIKPLISAIICGAVAFISFILLDSHMNIYFSTLLSIGLAGVSYVISIIILKVFDEKDTAMLKNSGKFGKILAKLHIIR